MNVESAAKEIRKEIIKMVWKGRAAHLGSALSLVEILYVLYFKTANYSKENMDSPDRDKIILSKGHGSAALYSVLHKKGIISDEEIDNYSVNGGKLPCHIDMYSAKGLEASSGSLGHGIGIAEGMALADKMDGRNTQVYAVIGDGEANEGSVWEAVEFAAARKLDNFTVIVDFNGIQSNGFGKDIIDQSNLSERFKAFGFEAYDIDGHDCEALEKTLKLPHDRPKAIIAHTVKGKGVSFMENTVKSHYVRLDDALYEKAMSDIENNYGIAEAAK